MNRSVEIMMEEHQNILRMLKVVRKICLGVMKGGEINYDDFAKAIDFIRTYADSHHHGKEERYLFKEMQNHLGKIGDNLITHGMLVEHDYGRFYMQELREALDKVREGDEESRLDVIANAVCYTRLLERHIKKEDDLVYTYGMKNLPADVLAEVDQLSERFEEEAMAAGTQEKYKAILVELEEKYM